MRGARVKREVSCTAEGFGRLDRRRVIGSTCPADRRGTRPLPLRTPPTPQKTRHRGT